MKCPNDQSTLLITERQNIEIDYCPECRGVWLDKGELDKLIDKGEVAETRQSQREYRDDNSHYNQGGYKKKRRESFLGDLFDF